MASKYKVIQYIYPEHELEYVLPFLKKQDDDDILINMLTNAIPMVEGFTGEELDEIILYAVMTNDPNDVRFIQDHPELCAQCGWCCTYCNPILIKGEDVERLGSFDGIIPYDERYEQIQTPCLYLKDGKCSVYEKRPNSCRTFPISVKNMTLIIQRTENCEMVFKFLMGKVIAMCNLVEKKRRKSL